VLLFASRLPDRRLAARDKPPWSLRELAGTFYVSPRFLVTYQAYCLVSQVRSAVADKARQVYQLGTVVQSVALPPSGSRPSSAADRAHCGG